ncbi:unnamed protein product [Protopolystoma xenopodis]|uniref:Uncharacterized protein n=1 Tax=Protopolystoma xenopodis TaxID=117903 RepID=A0A448XC44_9PLAT|nr:unnamed protein product [Protopolystoma xenopodis]
MSSHYQLHSVSVRADRKSLFYLAKLSRNAVRVLNTDRLSCPRHSQIFLFHYASSSFYPFIPFRISLFVSDRLCSSHFIYPSLSSSLPSRCARSGQYVFLRCGDCRDGLERTDDDSPETSSGINIVAVPDASVRSDPGSADNRLKQRQSTSRPISIEGSGNSGRPLNATRLTQRRAHRTVTLEGQDRRDGQESDRSDAMRLPEIWGGIRFMSPDLEQTSDSPVEEQSILEHVQIRHAGLLHMERMPAISTVFRYPRMTNLMISDCLGNAIDIVVPQGYLQLANSTVRNCLGYAFGMAILNGDSTDPITTGSIVSQVNFVCHAHAYTAFQLGPATAAIINIYIDLVVRATM